MKRHRSINHIGGSKLQRNISNSKLSVDGARFTLFSSKRSTSHLENLQITEISINSRGTEIIQYLKHLILYMNHRN